MILIYPRSIFFLRKRTTEKRLKTSGGAFHMHAMTVLRTKTTTACTHVKCMAAFNRFLAFLSAKKKGQITVKICHAFHMRTRSSSFGTQNCHCVYAYEMHRRQFSDAFRSFLFSRRKGTGIYYDIRLRKKIIRGSDSLPLAARAAHSI